MFKLGIKSSLKDETLKKEILTGHHSCNLEVKKFWCRKSNDFVIFRLQGQYWFVYLWCIIIIIRNNNTWCSKFIDVENRRFQYVQCVSPRGTIFSPLVPISKHLKSLGYLFKQKFTHFQLMFISNKSNISGGKNDISMWNAL